MLHKYKPLVFDAKSKDKLLHQKGTYFYKQKWFNYSIPVLCGTALLVGIYMALFPITNRLANAEEDYSVDTQALANNILELSLGMNPDNNAQSSTNITAPGAITFREYQFTAKVGNSTGYRIYIQAASGYTGNLAGLANPREEITGVGVDVDTNSFPINTWGYGIGELTSPYASIKYNTVPENGTTKAAKTVTSATPDSGTSYKLVFAAKIGGDKPTDHYQTKVLLSLAARPSTITTLSNITYMQEMTPDVCADTNENTTKRLTDYRDGKKYWVAKLKDGNCWMTQNLAYSGGPSTTLVGWGSSYTLVQYYDPGLYVKTNPGTNGYCSGLSGLDTSACVTAGWKNVTTGYTASETITSNIISGTIYDAHYLVGNYYSWAAVTGGTGNSIVSGDAPGSVCPDRWQLPAGGVDRGSGSFYYLLKSYNFNFVDGMSSSLTSTTGQSISAHPLYFLRGGVVQSNTYTAGVNGYYWTSTIINNSYDTARSLYLRIDDNVRLNLGLERYWGASVRCVAK